MILRRGIFIVLSMLLLALAFPIAAQKQQAKDSVFLLNGHIILEEVVDTLDNEIVVRNPLRPFRTLEYDADQLFMVKYANGLERYYYSYDPSIGNWFTADEVRMFMRGERDARKHFVPKGSLIGGGISGLIAGATGSFWSPLVPYGYMAFSGITKVKIKESSIGDPAWKGNEAYTWGYERVARDKRKLHALISGTVGLALGYTVYALFHNRYPESINLGFSN